MSYIWIRKPENCSKYEDMSPYYTHEEENTLTGRSNVEVKGEGRHFFNCSPIWTNEMCSVGMTKVHFGYGRVCMKASSPTV